ncbi:hypothetical protein NL676_034179 [Syzygium grande]|nr:hypothetical protein NL676_034179 [Syzygium grande]
MEREETDRYRGGVPTWFESSAKPSRSPYEQDRDRSGRPPVHGETATNKGRLVRLRRRTQVTKQTSPAKMKERQE